MTVPPLTQNILVFRAVFFLACRLPSAESSFLRWRTVWRCVPRIRACVGGALPDLRGHTCAAITSVATQVCLSGSIALANARYTTSCSLSVCVDTSADMVPSGATSAANGTEVTALRALCRRGTRRVSARRVEPDVVRHGVGSSVRTGVVLIQIDTTKLTRGL